MKINKKIILILIFLLSGLTALSAKNYPVPTEFPTKIYIQNVGTYMNMTEKNGEVKLYSQNKNDRAQQWFVYTSSGGAVMLKNVAARKYLAIKTKKTGKLIKKKSRYLGVDSKYTKVKFLALGTSVFLMKVSDSEVADAKGGVKKKKQGQSVIPYGLNNGKNQKWRIYYEKDGRLVLFNYKAYAAEKNRAEQQKNQGSSYTLEQALKSSTIGSYMKSVNYSQFRKENNGNVLLNHINIQKEEKKYSLIDTIVSYVKDNSSAAVRIAVYGELSKVELTSDNFAIRLLKGKLKEKIQKAYSSEKNNAAKKYLKKLMDKY